MARPRREPSYFPRLRSRLVRHNLAPVVRTEYVERDAEICGKQTMGRRRVRGRRPARGNRRRAQDIRMPPGLHFFDAEIAAAAALGLVVQAMATVRHYEALRPLAWAPKGRRISRGGLVGFIAALVSVPPAGVGLYGARTPWKRICSPLAVSKDPRTAGPSTSLLRR
jgi:hypothetical protein